MKIWLLVKAVLLNWLCLEYFHGIIIVIEQLLLKKKALILGSYTVILTIFKFKTLAKKKKCHFC